MSNVAVTARWNETKAQMTREATADGVGITDITLTRIGIMYKEYETDTGHLPQVSFIERVKKIIKLMHDYNFLDRVEDGTYPTGFRFRGLLSATSLDEYTVEPADSLWWDAASDGELVVQVGGESGWSKTSATIELQNISDRMLEVLREEVFPRVGTPASPTPLEGTTLTAQGSTTEPAVIEFVGPTWYRGVTVDIQGDVDGTPYGLVFTLDHRFGLGLGNNEFCRKLAQALRGWNGCTFESHPTPNPEVCRLEGYAAFGGAALTITSLTVTEP